MKNFDEIYKNICDSSVDNLEAERKKILSRIIISILIFLAIFIIGEFTNRILCVLSFVPLVITTILLFSYNGHKYNKIYKNNIISRLVSEYDSNLYYDSKSFITKFQYNSAGFELNYDDYYANDLISGKLENKIDINIGDVKTVYVSSDNEGHTTKTTIFQGLFSIVTLDKNINSYIQILLNKILNPFSSKNKIAMDSQEFEKYFDIYSDNKILAMRILTSDIMDYMLNFKKENKVKFEISIRNQQLFIRIHCQDMFEGSLIKSSTDYQTLYIYYKYLDFICELNKKIYNIISSKDI